MPRIHPPLLCCLLLSLLVVGCPNSDTDDTFDTSIDDTGGDTDTDSDSDSDTDTDTDTDIDLVVCPGSLPTPPAGEVCAVTGDPSTSTHLLLEGVVLGEEIVYDGGGLLVEQGTNGLITCVGCDCAGLAPAATLSVTCPEGVISPGLINPHDHIRYNLVPPQWPPGDERYDHRHDWREGLRGHTELHASATNTRDAVLYGELRMLFSGTTSIAGSIYTVDAGGLLRNLDSDQYNEGLGSWEADYRTFPLGDSDGMLRASGCDDYDIDDASRLGNRIYLPHISEGIDPEARNEFTCMSSDLNGGTDLVAGNTSIIHGVGLTPTDIGLMASEGARLVWSPRSNIHLYGHTAAVVEYDNFGVLISLGTDWVPSGSSQMLRELQCADYLDTYHFGDAFSDRDLWRMATFNAAQALGADQLGLLAEDYVADVAIYDGRLRSPYRAVLDAAVDDVVLVLRGGTPLHGDDAVVSSLVPTAEQGLCEAFEMCGRDKRVCAERDAGKTMADIETAVGSGAYPIFHCLPPADEPSCVPLRNNEDSDGSVYPTSVLDDDDDDGIRNSEDNCPKVFNPPRPLDGYAQGDFDLDG
ncbi:MAG: amidohydrolase family protein, partial [Deltaproteobacteria bacterium]|nr:amidohydrolase family protein [Deltaproteobacteria bacterium]